ncbi:MAG TPA: CvpA family protein [Candidatus Methylomirabilis sp.]|nr:CvpA family protein [Candidatus Methylomirabilis sp.]
MNGLDLVLIIILAIWTWRGLSTGLIKAVGAFLGIVAGAFLASHFYLALFAVSQSWFGGYDNIGKVLCFVFIFIVTSWAVHFLFLLIDKTYNLLAIIPFLKSINRLAGGILALLVASLVLGLLLYVTAKYVPAGSMVGDWLTQSKVTPILLAIAQIFLPVLAGGLKDIKSLI